MKLTIADVNRLIQDPSAETRADTAAKVAQTFSAASLSPAERDMAEAIFRAMLHDAEVRVRRALAENLKSDPTVPADVVKALATDTVEVASPILEFSSVLSEQDLIDIVRAQSPEHQTAIAKRSSITPAVASAVAESGDEAAVATLMTNRKAELPEAALMVALDRFADSDRVKRPMVMRNQLPMRVAERLVALVSDSLQERLVTTHELSPDLAADLVLQSRERATVGLGASVDRPTLTKLIGELKKNGRLTHTIIIRALCTGDLDFFETALAALAEIPVENAWRLIHDGGGRGLDAICARSGIPLNLMKLVRIGVGTAREMQYDGRPGDRDRFQGRVIERILTHLEQEAASDNVDYLIGKLSKLTQTAA